MGEPRPADPVKLIVALLWNGQEALAAALGELRQNWGDLDFQGPDHPFDATGYYEPEMGPGLQRRLLSFARLVSPGTLAAAKLACNGIENRLTGARGRRVNLDVGYLDHNKLVLASVKPAGQKIYLSDGVYADLIARYKAGRYQPFEWTFPDFRDGRYDGELAAIRRTYIDQLRSGLQSRRA